jgi:arsenite methyltransferase
MNGQEITKLKNPYFDVQAEIGITKHMGGLKATKELVELCQIDPQKYVLVVGCGNGISACKIAKIYGCRIMGIDLSEAMVEVSGNRAKKERLTERVEFRVADAQDLPFKDNVFDAVISESVTAFPKDKAKAVDEYVRVLKKGGHVGLNEVTWMQEPSIEMVEYGMRAIGGVKPETAEGWEKLLRDSGLEDIVVRPYKLKKMEQAINEVKLSGINTSFKAMGRMLWLYFTKPAYRKAMNYMARDAMTIPRDFMKCYGYGIYSGKKPL